MKALTRLCLVLLLALSISTSTPAGQTLFTNVKVFDGTSDKLKSQDVLVEDNLIKQIGKNISAPEGAKVIDGGGRTLMPGLIDSHVHLTHTFSDSGVQGLEAMTSVPGQLAALTGQNNPYPGKLGVIEEGAYADILLVDGNPLEDLAAIGADKGWFDAEPRSQNVKNIRFIMKDGKIYKDTL